MQSLSHTPSVYQIRHIESGKVYVGSTNDPRERCYEHQRLLRNGTHFSRRLQHAWNKHGESAFVFEIIEAVLFVEDLTVREQYWMDSLRATDSAYGYNHLPKAGSVLGIKRSDATRAKIAANAKARNADPEVRAANAARANAQFADPSARAAARERTNAQFADPAARARASERTKAQWADPDYRAKMTEHLKRIHADPDIQARIAETAKNTYADPAWRAKTSARRRKK